MFFVVDVETSGLTPWSGQLLTVGIQAVSEEGNLVGDTFYQRLKHTAPHPLRMKAIGYKLSDTYAFWVKQDPKVMDEAFADCNGPRLSVGDFKKVLHEYVISIEPEFNKRFIAANPVAFDKMWLESIYGEHYEEWPFHYRCLCLRSMRYGLEPESTYGSRSGNQKSEFPHHAYYDARAEAYDLQDLIRIKDSIHLDIEATLQS